MRIASAVLLALLPVMGVAFTPSVRSLGLAVVRINRFVSLLIRDWKWNDIHIHFHIGIHIRIQAAQSQFFATNNQLTLEFSRHGTNRNQLSASTTSPWLRCRRRRQHCLPDPPWACRWVSSLSLEFTPEMIQRYTLKGCLTLKDSIPVQVYCSGHLIYSLRLVHVLVILLDTEWCCHSRSQVPGTKNLRRLCQNSQLCHHLVSSVDGLVHRCRSQVTSKLRMVHYRVFYRCLGRTYALHGNHIDSERLCQGRGPSQCCLYSIRSVLCNDACPRSRTRKNVWSWFRIVGWNGPGWKYQRRSSQ